MTRRLILRTLVRTVIGLMTVATLVVFYLGYLKPLSGEATTPAGYTRNFSRYLTMRDGTRLAVDVWLPGELRADEQLPTIMEATRYWRAPAMGPLYRLLVSLGQEQIPHLEEADAWNGAGYALVLADTRGSGASFGQRPVEWSDAEIGDLGEVIGWIASQPWSNGRVGAQGISYSGNTAELSMVSNPPALKAVAPLYSDFDPLLFLAMPGGVYNTGFIKAWNAANQALDADDVCKLENASGLRCWWLKLAVPGVKPVDEDVRGQRLRQAVQSHKTLDLAEALSKVSYRDDTLPDQNIGIGEVSPYGYLETIEAAQVPMLVRVGWLDAATADGALSRYLSSDAPQELVIGAWSHGGYNDVDPFRPRLSYPEPRSEVQFAALVAFFDHYLKEKVTTKPVKSIRYYTMNEGRWRTTRTWPPREVTMQRWYFSADHRLAKLPPIEAGQDRYTVNFSASSGEKTRWHTNMGGGDVFYPDRAEEDTKLLSYTSPPLEHDLRITGTPVVSLELASTQPDGALHVYLEGIAPDGRVTYLTEGILRLIHQTNKKARMPYRQLGSKRTFRREDAEPLTPNTMQPVTLPLYATSVRLEAGHRLRVAIAGHDASLFARYPAEGVPTLSVGRSAKQRSYLELPVAAD